MSMTLKELTSMAKVAVGPARKLGTYSVNGENFSTAEMNETLREELRALGGHSYKGFRENKNAIFSLIEEVVEDILPVRVLEAYGHFAEIKTYAQGDKPYFTHRTGKVRAKQFITRVGHAGIYEVFKLGNEKFEVTTSAIGGAAQIGFEEFLDGHVDFAELIEVVMEGMDELIYREIAKALISSVGQLPAANLATVSGFDETAFDRLISTASAYGPATVYCTHEFAVKVLPQDVWVSEDMRNERWSTGLVSNYKGSKIVVLPQSFEDETNATKVIDPGYVWIIGGSEAKPVKIAFEGETIVRDIQNTDMSTDFQVYKKVGVGVMMTSNICCYTDTTLENNLTNA